jgi:hypothetical protein
MKRVDSGAVVFVFLAGFAMEVEARPRREICETWRDYYYSVETGRFIEWIGEPYTMCWYDDEPWSRPRDNPHPDYDGGWGTPRDSGEQQCKQCARNGKACKERATKGTDKCRNHYREWAQSWCERYKTDIDNRLVDDFKCEKIGEGPHGKPVMKCHGKGIDRCVESYEKGSPTSTSQSTIRVNIGNDWFGGGADHSSSVTWGGRKGFVEGCRDAETEAYGKCFAQQETCEEDAGGCQ